MTTAHSPLSQPSALPFSLFAPWVGCFPDLLSPLPGLAGFVPPTSLDQTRARRDDLWFCRSAVSVDDHHGGQRGRERHGFPLIPPETRIRTAIGRPAGLRCAITGSRSLTNPFHAEPASAKQGQWKVDHCDDHGSRPVRARARHRSIDRSGAGAGFPWARPGEPRSHLMFRRRRDERLDRPGDASARLGGN